MRRLLGHHRVLIITAVEAERAAIVAGLNKGGYEVAERIDHVETGNEVCVLASGVGSAAAAAMTGHALATASWMEADFSAVLSAGIGGGFVGPVEVGGLAIATESIAADLGAESPDGFIPLEELGFGAGRFAADLGLLRTLAAALPTATAGSVLTVNTVTGTAERTEQLLRRCPGAVAEGMEGFGVAVATAAVSATAFCEFGEIRAISNPVGPRDRSAWQLPLALSALTEAFAALARFEA